MSNTSKRAFNFVAVNPYVAKNSVLPTETLSSSKNMVYWGDNNAYPDYLLDLYNSVPTLKSCIDGTRDYICGDDVTIAPMQTLPSNIINKRGDTILEQVRDIAKDHELYGGFALQIIRNLVGEVCEVYYIDMRYLRTNKDCNVFYYCENWGKGGTRKNIITYPAFMPYLDWASMDDKARELHASSILFVKDVHTQVYPAPKYSASVEDCEIERGITDYHRNSIENGFTPSVMVNFNNGIPEEEDQEELERLLNEKFAGHTNGGRIMCSFNADKESATTIETIKVEDFGARYDALAKHSRQMIFTSFRANPNLFGVPTESNGFNAEEYESSFKLFNRTQVKPVQKMICDAYDKIYGASGVMTIKPFTLEGETENIVK